MHPEAHLHRISSRIASLTIPYLPEGQCPAGGAYRKFPHFNLFPLFFCLRLGQSDDPTSGFVYVHLEEPGIDLHPLSGELVYRKDPFRNGLVGIGSLSDDVAGRIEAGDRRFQAFIHFNKTVPGPDAQLFQPQAFRIARSFPGDEDLIDFAFESLPFSAYR